MRIGLLLSLLLWGGLAMAMAAEEPVLEPMTIQGDLVVDKPLAYRGKHLKIHGNLVFAPGGELTLEDSTCEVMCTYAREFLIQWRGGRLRWWSE
mgnify:CR=1 FL=1